MNIDCEKRGWVGRNGEFLVRKEEDIVLVCLVGESETVSSPSLGDLGRLRAWLVIRLSGVGVLLDCI